MPFAPPTACTTSLCGNPAVPGTWRCLHCTKATPFAEPTKNYPKRRNEAFYQDPVWTKFTKNMKVFNSQCQELDANGIQCPNPARVSHHLIDPSDRPDLKLTPSNIVCLCWHHQNRGQRGDDGKANYAPTKYKFPFTHEIVIYEHRQTKAGEPAHMSWIGQ
jgi:hypothetical protein